MHNSAYLSRSRHNVYYFRWPIPQAIHPCGKRTHIKVSLRTSDNYTALQVSQSLTYIGQHLTHKAVGYEIGLLCGLLLRNRKRYRIAFLFENPVTVMLGRTVA